MRVVAGALLAAAMACGGDMPAGIDRRALEGAWTSEGETFAFVIGADAILFEFDMREHPYRLDGDTLVIDFEDPVLGVQRKRILRLTDDELELSDEQWDGSTVYRRLR